MNAEDIKRSDLIKSIFKDIEKKVLRYCDPIRECTECKLDKITMDKLLKKYLDKYK